MHAFFQEVLQPPPAGDVAAMSQFWRFLPHLTHNKKSHSQGGDVEAQEAAVSLACSGAVEAQEAAVSLACSGAIEAQEHGVACLLIIAQIRA